MIRLCNQVLIMKIGMKIGILLFLVLLSASTAVAINASGNVPVEEEPWLLKLAIHPYLPAEEVYSRFVPLSEYLTERLGRQVIIEISPNYTKHIEQVGLGYADLAFMGPAAYVIMTEKYKTLVHLLATLEVDGRSTFRGVIIARKGSRLREFSDLIGKSFAFGDINSTMSHIVPRYMMFEAGLTVKAFSDYKFLRNHDNVALGVLYGKFDAGAVKREVFDEYEHRGLKALARTPKISEHVFVASHKLPDDLARKIREAFMDLNTYDDASSVLFPIKRSITGLVPASDHDYDNLRTMIRTLEATGAFSR